MTDAAERIAVALERIADALERAPAPRDRRRPPPPAADEPPPIDELAMQRAARELERLGLGKGRGAKGKTRR